MAPDPSKNTATTTTTLPAPTTITNCQYHSGGLVPIMGKQERCEESGVTTDDDRIECQNPFRDSAFDAAVDDNLKRDSYIAELDDVKDDKPCTGTVGGIGIAKRLGAAGTVLFTGLFTFLLSRANESVSWAPLVLGIGYEVGDCTSVNPGSTCGRSTAALGTITTVSESLRNTPAQPTIAMLKVHRPALRTRVSTPTSVRAPHAQMVPNASTAQHLPTYPSHCTHVVALLDCI
jgi:hypothetical protein